MRVLLCLLTGLLVSGAVYMMLNRNLVKYLFGLIILSNATNLILFTSGQLTEGVPAFVSSAPMQLTQPLANCVPQALILTAIVIGFGLLAFALVLAYRAYEELGSVDMDEMRLNPNIEYHEAGHAPRKVTDEH